ncbi:MAG: lipopolysaccharide kinase InaA family protein [Desulfobacterales bacterium]|jgi:tRNA A-37 threonylcarbamoyl transferase component Bud32
MELINKLHEELSGFQTKNSPVFSNITLDKIFRNSFGCKIIKNTEKRQVFYLQTSKGDYFLKLSHLVRTKDRLRHHILPWRRWAEWRNLHKLMMLGIETAEPVIKGERWEQRPKSFFIVTKKVDGISLNEQRVPNPGNLGKFFAELHLRGIYHADFHPANVIIKPNGQSCLIDVQEVYTLGRLPKWLRVSNLGKLFFGFVPHRQDQQWFTELLSAYNKLFKNEVNIGEVERAGQKHRKRYYRSRAKRCCKNSSEFAIVNFNGINGYKRKEFQWGRKEIENALRVGKKLKEDRVIAYKNVCLKIHEKRILHRDRCFDCWKNSRALEVRNIPVPKSLGYYRIGKKRFFLSEYLESGIGLNDYLSSIKDKKKKRMVVRGLAFWLKKIHDRNVWQRDFNSDNVLYTRDTFVMIDLDGVRIRNLSEKRRIVNLAQLNASLSNAVTYKDRIRFFHCYSLEEKLTRQKRRSIYKKVWEITRTKNTKVFGLVLDELK